MTPSARLQAVLDLLSEIGQTPRPADALASGYFRARRYIGSHDRAAVSSMLYAILRHHARLGWWIARLSSEEEHIDERQNKTTLPLREGRTRDSAYGEGSKDFNPSPAKTKALLRKAKFSLPLPQGERDFICTPRTRLLAWLALAEKKSQQQIEAMGDGGKFSLAPLTGHERALLKRLENHTIEHPEMPDIVRAECPDWAVASLKQRFGEDFMREMEALLQPAPLDLRVNLLKSTREDALAELRRAGLKAEPCRLSQTGIRVRERPNLNALAVLKEGRVEIQDEGSQLVALLVEARPGMRVADFCAGAGGKTLAVAVQMQNKGHIVACDVLAGRLRRSAERFRRAGLHNIEVKQLENARDPWIKKHRGGFDRVLADAPCTGTGAWRRNPDARWRSEGAALGPGLEALVKLQAEILESAAKLVKPGGRLIYATCSLLPEENERQVEKFLEAHPEFRVIPVSEVWEKAISNSSPLEGRGIRAAFPPPPCLDPYLSLTPLQHGTDGFFAAVVERAVTPLSENPPAP